MTEYATAVLVGGPADGASIAIAAVCGRIEVATRQYSDGLVLAVYSLVGGVFTLPESDGGYRYGFVGYDDRRRGVQ